MDRHARVAKSADAKDLKSFFRQRECGFKSHPGHHAQTSRIPLGELFFLQNRFQFSIARLRENPAIDIERRRPLLATVLTLYKLHSLRVLVNVDVFIMDLD